MTFKVGDAVVVDGTGTFPYLDEVVKVHKSGNFVLSKHNVQWRQSGIRAGRDSWSAGVVYAEDDKRGQRALIYGRRRRAVYALEKLACEIRKEGISVDPGEILRACGIVKAAMEDAKK